MLVQNYEGEHTQLSKAFKIPKHLNSVPTPNQLQCLTRTHQRYFNSRPH